MKLKKAIQKTSC